MKLKSNIWLAFICLPFLSFSQLNVTATGVANTLAQTIAGNGVTISNASINCANGASGTFSYTGGNLGINGGIILTTGAAADADNAGLYFCNVLNGNTVNDPDLMNIEPLATNDVCVLEFDFVPICSSISITFAFGSEEYPMFVNSTFNDGFGIFLTGPNPGGGNYTSYNMGTLPNLVPVSINNVNATTNAAYFVDNYTSPNADIAYDGYTIPITSTKSVTPCSTYHMKIGIADAGDEAYDSGVFIGGNAVSCQNAPAVTATATPANCSGNTGTASATVTSYTGAITYSWTPGGATTASLTGLSPGTYTCVVGLNLSCGLLTQTVTAVVGSTGSTLNLTTTQQNPFCNNGSNGTATVNITGGTAPYSTSWNTAPVQTTLTASNLSSAIGYVVTVTDNAGCVKTATVTLVNPAPMQLSTGTTPSTCSSANGNATVNVLSGGTAPFSYVWNTSPVQNTQTAANIVAGTYTVVITDVNSCTVTVAATVNLQNGGWTVSANTPTNVACFGGNNGAGSVTIGTPGTSIFTYSWNTSPNQNTQTAINLPLGNYTCTVSDNNGCTQTTTLTITQPTVLAAGPFAVTSSKCGSPTGVVTIASVNGGTPPYSYSWNSTPIQTTQNLSNVIPGTYSLTITDSKGCIKQYTQTVGTTVGLPLAASATPERCFNSTGTVFVSATGTAPYQYLWNTTPPKTTQTVSGLPSGSYVAQVTDFYGCQDLITVSVNNIDDILFTNFSTNPQGEITAGDNIGITITPSSGWSLDTGLLSDGNLIIAQSVLHVFAQYGTYYATYYFTSANGCKDTVVEPIKVTDYITLYIPNAFSPNGDGKNDFFGAEGTFISSFEMSVFDRWGQLVTKIDNIDKSWNGTYKGKDALEDTYIYKGSVRDVFGKSRLFHGQVNLVR